MWNDVSNLPNIAKRKTKCGSNDKNIPEKWPFTCICRKVSYAQDFHRLPIMFIKETFYLSILL